MYCYIHQSKRLGTHRRSLATLEVPLESGEEILLAVDYLPDPVGLKGMSMYPLVTPH